MFGCMGGDVGEGNSISIQVCKGVTEPLIPTEHLQKSVNIYQTPCVSLDLQIGKMHLRYKKYQKYTRYQFELKWAPQLAFYDTADICNTSILPNQ